MKADYYRSIVGFASFLGDFLSRLVFEKVRLVFPGVLLIGTLAGVLMVISGVSEVMVLGVFIIMWVNGWIYV